jgi:predicted xylose isomerase-like sugar epimerase
MITKKYYRAVLSMVNPDNSEEKIVPVSSWYENLKDLKNYLDEKSGIMDSLAFYWCEKMQVSSALLKITVVETEELEKETINIYLN